MWWKMLRRNQPREKEWFRWKSQGPRRPSLLCCAMAENPWRAKETCHGPPGPRKPWLRSSLRDSKRFSVFDPGRAQDFSPGLSWPRTSVLGYSQSSLRDSRVSRQVLPGLTVSHPGPEPPSRSFRANSARNSGVRACKRPSGDKSFRRSSSDYLSRRFSGAKPSRRFSTDNLARS